MTLTHRITTYVFIFLWLFVVPSLGGIYYYYTQGLTYKDDIVEEFTIQSEQDFMLIYNSDAKNDIYQLDRNITLSHETFQMIGTKKSPFRGVFNGNGYVITISSQTRIVGDGNYEALFGYNKGTIKNLVIKDANFIHAAVNSSILVAENHGIIENVMIKDSHLKITDTVRFAGIIAGSNHGIIRHVYANGSIVMEDVMTNRAFVGGLVGFDWNEDNDMISYALSLVDVSTFNETLPSFLGVNRSVGIIVGSMKNQNKILFSYYYSQAVRFYSDQSNANIDLIREPSTLSQPSFYANTLLWPTWMINHRLVQEI